MPPSPVSVEKGSDLPVNLRGRFRGTVACPHKTSLTAAPLISTLAAEAGPSFQDFPRQPKDRPLPSVVGSSAVAAVFVSARPICSGSRAGGGWCKGTSEQGSLPTMVMMLMAVAVGGGGGRGSGR